MAKDISIIVINYNTKNLTLQCLRTLKKHTKVNYEVILIDNASTDGSRKAFSSYASKNKDIIYVKNDTNTGFAKAVNQGIKLSKAKHILLLNSDTIFTENSIDKMLELIKDNQNVDISSCKLLNSDNSLQVTGGYFPYLSQVFMWMFFIDDLPFIKNLIKPFHPSRKYMPTNDPRFFDSMHKQDWITGAFFLIDRKVIDKVGVFDESYFMYMEELDFCYRAAKKGFKCWYIPETSIIHLGGASSNANFALISEIKGLVTFYKKHFSLIKLSILRLILFLGLILRSLIYLPINITYTQTYLKSIKNII